MATTNRRHFLKTSVLAAGVAVAAVPAVAQAQGAGDRVRVGIVGLRGRGKSHIEAIRQMEAENVELAALCDCDESVLASALDAYEKQTGQRPAAYKDLRKLLEDKSIDAVTYATPNHWHSLGVIWACQAGKDVYVEKPGSHNIREGRKMVEAARKYQRMVQHGTQCRSSPNIREGIAKLKEGVIGEVYMARGLTYKLRGSLGFHSPRPVPPGLDWDLWTGPGPKQDYSTFNHQRWHWRWDFGNGDVGNQGVHQLDLVRWAMDLQTHPLKVQSMGGKYTHEDSGETPMVQNVCYQFAGRKLIVEFAVRNWYTNSEAGFRDVYPFVQPDFPVGTIFLGTEGYMLFPDYSSYYTFLGPKRELGPSAKVEGSPIMDLPHFQNWIGAVRSRKPEDLNAEILQGHYSAAMCHVANIAYRTGRTLQFDADKEQFVADPEADHFLAREPRPPFAVPEQV